MAQGGWIVPKNIKFTYFSMLVKKQIMFLCCRDYVLVTRCTYEANAFRGITARIAFVSHVQLGVPFTLGS